MSKPSRDDVALELAETLWDLLRMAQIALSFKEVRKGQTSKAKAADVLRSLPLVIPLSPSVLKFGARFDYSDPNERIVEPRSLVRPLDLTGVQIQPNGDLNFTRYRASNAGEARGHVKQIYSEIITYSMIYAMPNSRKLVSLAPSFWGRPSDDTFYKYLSTSIVRPNTDKQLSVMAYAFARMQDDYERGWCVTLKIPGSLFGLTILTNATGAAALFRDREKPPAKDRKAALRHWVQGHWRGVPSDLDEETRVRRHLRGALDFEWLGFECKLRPSLHELNDLDEERVLREKERELGRDRRPATVTS